MHIRHMAAKALIPLLLAIHLAGPAGSQTPDNQLEDFFAAKQSAYRYYRSAWFYLRTDNIDLAALELSAFVQGWEEIRSRFATAPPGPFADDPLWREDLAEIASLAAAGMTALEAADADAAKASLAPIPRIMADMRARNGVVTFSDAVDGLTQAMESLWRYRHETADFDDTATRTELNEGTERLRAAFERVRDDAPDDIAFDDQFMRLVGDSDAAVDRLEQAVAAQDQTALVNAIRELRSFERLLWLNFG
ncbi:MAG: hypothetical protein ACR2PO_03480 [Methyloligellaceae bacterium]